MSARPFGLACLALCLTACSAAPASPDAGPARDDGWRVIKADLPATLLSAWQAPDGALFTVGGGPAGGYVLSALDGRWWEMDPGTSRTLWWVTGFSSRDVYAVGERGVVTHFDGERWTVLREGVDATLYGAWGRDDGNLWAVGGAVLQSPQTGLLVTPQAGWAAVEPSLLPADRPLFKVWGAPNGTLIVVGEGGLLAEGQPGAWQLQTTPATERLTTVHGAGNVVYAVGGLRQPIALRRTAAGWLEVPVPGAPALLNGVAVNAAGAAVIVGLDGYVAESTDAGFHQQTTLTTRGLHGALATRDGFLAVGGALSTTFGHGVLLGRGGTWPSSNPSTWPQAGVRFDGGVEDAGVVVPDGGFLGPGALCEDRPADCDPTLGLRCWFVFGPYRSWCGGDCADESECGAYGAGACCKVPGPQVSQSVCLPAEACDAG